MIWNDITKNHMQKTNIWIFILIGGLMLAGCAPLGVTGPEQGTLPPDIFTERVMGEDGLGYDLSGPTHLPLDAARATYELQLRNESETAWTGRYCLQLVDRQRVIETLARERFELAPQTSREEPLSVELPAALDAGRYGLIFVLGRPSGSTASISYLEVGAEEMSRPPQLAAIPQEVMEIARARCIPITGDVPPGAAAEDVVRLFYSAYLDFARFDPEADTRRNPLVEGFYRESDYLAPSLIERVDAQVAGDAGFDPFLCAQDVPTTFDISGATIDPDAVYVQVQTGLGNAFQVVVENVDGAWQITDVLCHGEREE